MRKKWLVILLISCNLLTGCLETNILEDLSIMVAIGYDVTKDKHFQVTTSLLESQPEAKDKNRTVTVKAETSKGARRKMNEKLPFETASGQTRVILLDRNIFQMKMVNEIDVLSRDASYGDMIYMALVDGTAKDILSYSYKSIPNIGVYLNTLLEHNEKWSWSPDTTLHRFTRCRDRNTEELALPIIKREGEDVAITGVALFHGDQLVGEVSPRDGFYLKVLTGEGHSYLYQSTIKLEETESSGMKQFLKDPSNKEDINIVFSVLDAKRQIKVKDAQQVEFDVNLQLEIDIQEISERYLFQEKDSMKALRDQLNEELTKDLQSFLDKLVKMNSDCVGFGEILRSKVRKSPMVGERWGKEFPNAKLNAHVDVKMIRTGTIE